MNPLISTMKVPSNITAAVVGDGISIPIEDGYVDVPNHIAKELEAHGFKREARPAQEQTKKAVTK